MTAYKTACSGTVPLIALLGTGLRGGTCRAYTSDLRLRVPKTGLATYPDVAVISGEPERDPNSPTHVLNPAVLFEVLSPGTEEYDRGEKREHYEQLDSLREYVVVAQKKRQVDVWRLSDDGAFRHETLRADEVLVLASLELSLPIDRIYGEAGLKVD